MKLGIVIVAILAAVGFWYVWGSEPETPGMFRYQDAEVVAQGQVLYGEYCASCHGTNLEGEPNWRDRDADGYLPAPPHDETGHTWHHPDQQLARITKLGTAEIVGNGYKSNMIGFGEMISDEEIIAVLSYIKSTWPEQVIAKHNEINMRASQ